MAVKNIESGEVHVGTKGGTTGCGRDTNEHPENWVSTNEPITCDKNGCKN